jgi:hypothetical protein
VCRVNIVKDDLPMRKLRPDIGQQVETYKYQHGGGLNAQMNRNDEIMCWGGEGGLSLPRETGNGYNSAVGIFIQLELLYKCRFDKVANTGGRALIKDLYFYVAWMEFTHYT